MRRAGLPGDSYLRRPKEKVSRILWQLSSSSSPETIGCMDRRTDGRVDRPPTSHQDAKILNRLLATFFLLLLLRRFYLCE